MKKILILILVTMMMFSGVAIADGKVVLDSTENEETLNNRIMIDELKDIELIDREGYLLHIEEGKYGSKKTNNDFSFNKDKFWGSMTDEKGNVIELVGYLEKYTPQTLKYTGDVINKSNSKFEVFITKKQEIFKENYKYKASLNIFEYNDKDQLLDSRTYILENIASEKFINSIVDKEIDKSKFENITRADEYYQYQDAISGTGYGVQVYYPTGNSQDHYHLFRVNTKQVDVMNWLRDEYLDYEPAFAYGRDVDLFHNTTLGTVMGNINPTSSSKTYSITVGYGGFSVTIPVTFSTVSVSNSGLSNLYYDTNTNVSWVDNYPSQSGPTGNGKVFISEWSVNTSNPGNNEIKVKVKYYAGSEDDFGMHVTAYPIFSSVYKEYDSNN